MTEYKNTFNLASAAGQLITTIDKMNPARLLNGANVVGLSARRTLIAVNIVSSIAITQTFKVSIVDRDGTARLISSLDLVGATDAYFEPEHDVVIDGKENIQVDLTATGAPAATGTITVFTEER